MEDRIFLKEEIDVQQGQIYGLSHKWKNFLWLDHRERKDRAA